VGDFLELIAADGDAVEFLAPEGDMLAGLGD